MAPFARGASYHAVDLSLITENQPLYARQLVEEIMNQAKQGTFSAVKPLILKPIDELEEALRLMQAGKHTGKIVMEIKKEAQVSARQSASKANRFKADSTYVITGGTGGLGRSLVVWLAKNGARNIAVVSRSGEVAMRSPKWAVALDELRSFGARMFICKCDVGDKGDLQAALGRLAQEGAPPVRGVIHGAAVFKVS